MSLNLLLDSSLAKLQRTGDRQVSHDFTINFQPPIYLESGNYKATLDELITMSYSWFNINASYGNNKIRWRKKSEEWQTLIFPNGMYDYDDINRFLQNRTGKIDPKDKDSDYIFILYFDYTLFRVVILMHENYELDLSEGKFAELQLLGFEKKLLTGKKNFVGAMIPNITGLISRLANDVPSDVLYSFSTLGLRASWPFQKEPRWLKWHPVNKSMINSIRIWVMDERDNPLDLNGVESLLSAC